MKNEGRLLDKLREEIRQNLITIPEGSSIMGNDHYQDESPAHEVFLDEVKMSRYLITNFQYATFLNALKINNEQDGTYLYLNVFNEMVRIKNQNGIYCVQAGFESHPVTHVNWFGAYTFSRAVGGLLPTETEWEKACRGRLKGKTFPWGNKRPSRLLANFGENVGATTVVGIYPPNKYGLYDMSGNVWEWTMDWYHPGYEKETDHRNPTGPVNGVDKVIRGGGWAYPETDMRCSRRRRNWSKLGGTNIGFRVVIEVKKQDRFLSIKELRKELERFKFRPH